MLLGGDAKYFRLGKTIDISFLHKNPILLVLFHERYEYTNNRIIVRNNRFHPYFKCDGIYTTVQRRVSFEKEVDPMVIMKQVVYNCAAARHFSKELYKMN